MWYSNHYTIEENKKNHINSKTQLLQGSFLYTKK
nr:MAG TPA: hypothetical protein [Caudoviricetes sp.]